MACVAEDDGLEASERELVVLGGGTANGNIAAASTNPSLTRRHWSTAASSPDAARVSVNLTVNVGNQFLEDKNTYEDDGGWPSWRFDLGWLCRLILLILALIALCVWLGQAILPANDSPQTRKLKTRSSAHETVAVAPVANHQRISMSEDRPLNGSGPDLTFVADSILHSIGRLEQQIANARSARTIGEPPRADDIAALRRGAETLRDVVTGLNKIFRRPIAPAPAILSLVARPSTDASHAETRQVARDIADGEAVAMAAKRVVEGHRAETDGVQETLEKACRRLMASKEKDRRVREKKKSCQSSMRGSSTVWASVDVVCEHLALLAGTRDGSGLSQRADRILAWLEQTARVWDRLGGNVAGGATGS